MPFRASLDLRRTVRRGRGLLASLVLGLASALTAPGDARAATYTSASTTYQFIDSSTHTKVGYNTSPYRFTAASGCGTTPPVLDDTLSDAIPFGFTFKFGGTAYTSARIMTNGRLQFGNTLCGSGTASIGPPQTYPYGFPNASANGIMKIFGVDLDPTNLVDQPNYPSAAKKTPCTSSSTCYISYATLGAAPSRQFVVTWKSVPEWVSASNTSGSFDLQIILNEDGSFVYQYGDITHGGTGTAEIGWQLSTTDYQVLKFGASAEPPPFTAIAFFIPSALATYWFEQGAWVPGTAGQVLDSGSSALHGTALGSVQPAASGKICRGATVPLDTSGATVNAIRLGTSLSDATLNLRGTGTLAFWYRARDNWSSGTAGQLVDATTANGAWFSLARASDGKLAFVVTDSVGSTRVVETSAQTFAAETWVHVAIAWNFNGLAGSNQDSLTVFVNGTATTTSFSSDGTVAASAGYIHLGDNPIGSAHGKGTVNSANGDFDEAAVYNYVLSTTQVGVLMSATRTCTPLVVHHLEIQHATGTGVTCTPTVVTIKACGDAACSSGYTGGLSGTLTASGGVSTGFDPSSTFTIGAGTATTTVGVQLASPGSTVLGTSSVSISVTGAGTCNFGSPSCTLTASDSGLLLSLPDHVSDSAATLAVSAVRKADNAAVCVPAFASVSRSLTFTCGYQNPASGTRALRLAGTALNAAGNATAACDASGRSVPVSFDAAGTGRVTAQYADVGKLTVSARYVGSGTADAGLVMQGSTSAVVAPASFQVSGPAAGALTAGAAFSATVTALNASAAATPNFGRESVPEGVTLSWTRRSPTGAGARDGSFSGSAGAFSGGSASATGLVWTEVGQGDLTATLASGSYLGSGLGASGSTGSAGAIGPFRPASFRSTTTAACGSFSYGAQAFNVTVTALDALGNTTANYDGSAATTPAFARTVTLSDGSGNLRGVLAGSVAAASFTAGIGTGTATYTFTDKATGPQTVSLRATDSDGVASAGGSEGTMALRSGRLRLAHAFGSEKAPLQMPVLAEYHSGAAWIINAADSCSRVPAAAVALSNRRSHTGAATAAWSTTAADIVVSGGQALLQLSAPSPTATGTVDVALNLGGTTADQSCLSSHPSSVGAAIAWLRSRNGSCSTAWDRDPAARASFGIYSPESARTVHARDLF
ncbi:MAG: LamG domain-containing protein [Rubrivivax sp.]